MEVVSQSIANTHSSSLSRADQALFIKTAPNDDCEACVIVPVRNEARTLLGTLRALADQRDSDGAPLDRARYEVIVFANDCTDHSAALVRAFAARHPTLALHVVERGYPAGTFHVGHARRMLMDEACRRLLLLGRRRGVIASTDGDTRVASTWIAATLREVAQGADAVCGRIVTDLPADTEAGRLTRQYHLRDVGYRLLVAEMESLLDPDPHDPWPRHHQHFGASLAVTAGAYLRAGRLPVVPYLEDIALYQALRRVDARIRHSPAVRVTTSPRLMGRTEVGLAQQLREWTAMGAARQPHRVESATAVEARLRAHHSLRVVWRAIGSGEAIPAHEITTVAHALGIRPNWLADSLAWRQTFGVLAEQVEQQQIITGEWAERWPAAEIAETVRALRVRRADLWSGVARSAAREEIEAVAVAALTTDMAQLRLRPRDKRLMHGVAGEGVVGDMGRPVDEQQVAAG